jgi:hypothetical protein
MKVSGDMWVIIKIQTLRVYQFKPFTVKGITILLCIKNGSDIPNV